MRFRGPACRGVVAEHTKGRPGEALCPRCGCSLADCLETAPSLESHERRWASCAVKQEAAIASRLNA
jgi:hypothetical protein